ncbi:MAG: hypothetical protein J6Y37_11565 [Paludibacteraceae bacterium]|nr:hypothetical protein [Paludibacteraceae bacterium]
MMSIDGFREVFGGYCLGFGIPMERFMVSRSNDGDFVSEEYRHPRRAARIRVRYCVSGGRLLSLYGYDYAPVDVVVLSEAFFKTFGEFGVWLKNCR